MAKNYIFVTRIKSHEKTKSNDALMSILADCGTQPKDLFFPTEGVKS